MISLALEEVDYFQASSEQQMASLMSVLNTTDEATDIPRTDDSTKRSMISTTL